MIVRNDVERLTGLQLEQQKCLGEQRELERARAAASRDLAWNLGLEHAPPLSGLIAALPFGNRRGCAPFAPTCCGCISSWKLYRRVIAACLTTLWNTSVSAWTRSLPPRSSPARYGANLKRLTAPTFYIDSKA